MQDHARNKREVLLNVLARLFRHEPADSPWRSSTIIRDELFSIERLEMHARSLADAQPTTKVPPARRTLSSRLRENERVLVAHYHDIANALGEGPPISSAAEWFIDNYHLVEDQIRQIHDDLPPGFYRQLPKLATGPFSGYPRVFGMAWACTAHSDSRFESEALRRFVLAYQRVQPLTIGELWAIAISLRMVLVENLRRVVQQVRLDRLAQREADVIADQLLGAGGRPADPGALLRHQAQRDTLPPAFLVQVIKRLRDQDPDVTPALDWLEAHLAAGGGSADQLVQDEHHRQGAANVTVRNIITSMQLISDVDWSEFFEAVSLVDAVLANDGAFAQMDFPTRNLYRSAIEDLARGANMPELDVARHAVAAATASSEASPRTRDTGYHLMANGRPALERQIGYQPSLRDLPARLNAWLGPIGYMSGVATCSFLTLALPISLLAEQGVPPAWLLLLALCGAIPAIDLAVALVNRAVTRSVGATILPALEFAGDIPATHRTLVVVPTLLTTTDAIDVQIARLEVHALASSGGEIYYALLTDWCDAARQHEPGDDLLLAHARAGINQLNQKQAVSPDITRFFLLHRHRIWSDSEQAWMGWERKRGKLHELNRLLRGALDTTYDLPGGATAAGLVDVRNVITLDADTRLPRETVRRLIGKMAHPLNQPRLDGDGRRVIEGYAILQPRVTPSLPVGREGSLFQRVFSSMTGIDSYDAAAADVYQDLFGQGSYSGKGIYDIDAFEAALAERVPEGAMLSHDLFEGTFARAGLVSDIEVVEEYPSRYDVAATRNHRWSRGDWQLLPWIFGRADAARSRRRQMPVLGLWKMVDNLRRTLSAPTLVLSLLIGWLLAPVPASIWTLFMVVTIALPVLLPVLATALAPRPGVNARSHLHAVGADLVLATLQVTLVITFLAHQAWLMIDAITRTVYRLTVSHRHLLEWVTTAQAQTAVNPGVPTMVVRMWASVLAAAVVIGEALLVAQGAWWIMLPFACLWLAAPAIAVFVSVSPRVAGRVGVSAADQQAMRLVARRTWRYFETFVTVDDHMLPPDNFQETPRPALAHRTSPTNIGLYLLCVVSARDYGWIRLAEVVTRLEATLATMHRLQRFRGHLYNWYDTTDLRPLEPLYISSVDSGNLGGHLLTIACACRQWADDPQANDRSLHGVQDALLLTRQAFDRLPDGIGGASAPGATVESILSRCQHWFDAVPPAAIDDSSTAPERLQELDLLSQRLLTRVQTLTGQASGVEVEDLLFWTQATRKAVSDCQPDTGQPDINALDPGSSSGPGPAPGIANGNNMLHARLLALAEATRAFAMAMDFDFLLNRERKLLSIGYRVLDGTLDPSCYDLLASEARLASFLAIAKGDAPTRHWFRLGRAVTPVARGAALVSWSGSMFEYLMPSLVMRAPAGSLLAETNHLIVRRQIDYARGLGVPWGISESAYNARDLEFTYQYSNFGVPGLGLKRGLNDNLVVAPYATGLAAMIDPQAATENFARLASLGACGRFGFYEALDYTRTRLPDTVNVAIVQAFMAHHQGMTIVALANVLFDGRMRSRFHADGSVQATELLLQESAPRDVSVVRQRVEEVDSITRQAIGQQPDARRLLTADDATPQTHLLSNGRYSVMLTSAGSGYSRWQDLAITRWREDATCDDHGSYIYLRDALSGSVWSATVQPCGRAPDRLDVSFAEDRVEFRRRDNTITTRLQIIVSPEDDAEVRRLSLTNHGGSTRVIDVTSYCELVLAPPASDYSHPAFSKLFVQTEFLPASGALLATRRRREPAEAEVWVAHHVVMEGRLLQPIEYETDRARFIGRGHDVHDPVAVIDGAHLSGALGTVLDPVFALRQRVSVPAGGTISLAFWTTIAGTRAGVLDLLEKHRDPTAFTRAATLAWTQAQAQLMHLGIDAEDAGLFQQLAGHVLYANAAMRPASETLLRGTASQDQLWALGISGDLPLVVLRIDHVEDVAIARQLLQAHEYWRLKELAVDLVILNERSSSYAQDLQIALETAVRTSQSRPAHGRPASRGMVFVLRTDLIAPAARNLLLSVARIVLVSQRGSLAAQLQRRIEPAAARILPLPRPSVTLTDTAPQSPASPETGLQYFNGLGGFSPDGREYVITLAADTHTPMPWINVIANPVFGFQVAAEGGGYTWSLNSRENQLTQWSNDPVSNRPGEVLYLRDEESGAVWTTTASPIRDQRAPYVIQHGQGYSRFSHTAHDISATLLMYVPVEDPLKIVRLSLHNMSSRVRQLSVTAYIEWVLGTLRDRSAPTVSTHMDQETGALFARNAWHSTYGSRVAFVDLAGRQSEWTGDRREFIGRNGRLARPAAMVRRTPLSNRTGAGLDPCAALRTQVTLQPGEHVTLTLLLGQASDTSAARDLIVKYRQADPAAVLAAVDARWDALLGTLQVQTPDHAMDLLLNRWLLYQTVVCRLWARSAFYQSSGAWGFRDQLQDGMALGIANPALAREHLLRAAGRQFPSGDVQHWWLPQTGQGVRTRITDDRVWLAFATLHYLETTGDHAVLDEVVAFIESPALEATEHERFSLPQPSTQQATLFDHCVLALDDSLGLGPHGLPLIGTGDWNDGLNRVGAGGRGESVWLGWFLLATLPAFAQLVTRRGDPARGDRWRDFCEVLTRSIEDHAWDGAWYRRGYFDDGTPLGSSTSEEGRIDAIAQSWSVISGAGDPARSTLAMAAVEAYLMRQGEQLALLFTPPFDRSAVDPGYVKGYPPGIRENGGQYTHAAAWSIFAHARLGAGVQAARLFALLNPINHSATIEQVQRYQVEPYVVAADIYSVAPHSGRGGWTWYTGAAGWLYRAGIEAILGFHLQGDRVLLTPCIPPAWPHFEMTFRYRTARYEIFVDNSTGAGQRVTGLVVDGACLSPDPCLVSLVDDGQTHRVQVTLGC